MRYIINKMHILYNNVRKRARDARMCEDVREHTRDRPHDASFNILFLIKVGKYCASRNDIACGGDITS